MSCNYYRGKCLFLNGKEDGCNGCPIKKAYNKGVRDTKKDYERPKGHWIQKVCNFYWYRQFACSECEHEIICHEKTPNFCEECGADMRGERR